MLSHIKKGVLVSSLLPVGLAVWIAAAVEAQAQTQSDSVFLNGALVISATDDAANSPQFFPAFAAAPAGTTVSGINFYEVTVTGGTISDQLWIQPNPAANNQLFWYFSSDPFIAGQTDMPSNVPVVGSLVEDGTVQDVSSFFGSSLPAGTIAVKSDVEAPEPGTLALLGAGAAGLLAYGWRRRNALRA
jgi:hypothetical protein